MKIKIYLGLQAIIFVPYGLYCLIDPAMLSGAAGLVATTTTGTIELQSMYGGLQTAVGVMCALGVMNAAIGRSAVMALAFIFGGLAVVRVSLGLLQGDFSGYTTFAMVFETVSLCLCLWLLKSSEQAGDGVLNT